MLTVVLSTGLITEDFSEKVACELGQTVPGRRSKYRTPRRERGLRTSCF